MPNIRPFKAMRPSPDRVEDVCIYHGDAGDESKARAKAMGCPISMLNVGRSDLLLSGDEAKDESLVRSKSRNTLNRFKTDGILIEDADECFYFYRLSMGDHSQTGIVCCLDVRDYLDGTIKRHELTRMDKIHIQEKLIERVGGNMEPVLLVYDSGRSNAGAVTKLLSDWTGTHDSEYDFLDDGGIRHELWPVDEGTVIDELAELFSEIGSLYICDGHHRIAASADYYVSNVDAIGDSPTSAAAEKDRESKAEHSKYFMGAVFPSEEMLILDYNRAVRDLNGLTEDEFFDALRKTGFEIEEIGSAAAYPTESGEYTMVMNDIWYRLRYTEDRDMHDPVAGLDVSLLQNLVLRDILGIHDPQHDDRITFISGTKGLEGLQAATQKDMKIAFAILPPKMSDIMRVSDAGLTMPPKSTCFEPKLVSGMLIYRI